MKENETLKVGKNIFTISSVVQDAIVWGHWKSSKGGLNIYREIFIAQDENKNRFRLELYYYQKDTKLGATIKWLKWLKERDKVSQLQELINKNLGDKLEPDGYDVYFLERIDSVKGREDNNLCYIWRAEKALDFRGHWATSESAVASYIQENLPCNTKIILNNHHAYNVDENLNAFGAFSTVFRGTRQSDNLSVALKIQHTDTASHEANILQAFNGHKNIVSFIDFDDIAEYYNPTSIDKSNPFKGEILVQNNRLVIMTNLKCLVAEYIDGATLEKSLGGRKKRKSGISVTHAMNLIGQICNTVQDIHNMGFIHLDLKPQNIMKDKQGNIKLIDMGSVVEKNKDFIALGAGTYAAPEVREYILNQPTGWFSLPKLFKPNRITEGQSNQRGINVSEKARKKIAETADVFSIGAIFYHMLVGHEPRHIVGQESSSIKIENILVSKSDFSSETLCFMPVLAKALKVEPRKRIQTCKKLKREIDYAYQMGYHD